MKFFDANTGIISGGDGHLLKLQMAA